MQRQSQCRRAGLIERKRNSKQSNLLLGINTSERKRGTVKELLMLFTQEGAATCKATLLLMPTAFSPGCSEGAGAQRSLVCSKGAVDHCIVHRHANTDINPQTSDRHHRSRITNT